MPDLIIQLQNLYIVYGKIRHNAHAGSRARVTSMGGLYDAATLRALMRRKFKLSYAVVHVLALQTITTQLEHE